MKAARAPEGAAFRLVLAVGAVVAVALGVWGLVWSGMLNTVLGFKVPKGDAIAIVRTLGGVLLALGVGYALAAMQPSRSRGLLVPLFLAPLLMAVTTIAGVARGEIQGGKGVAFAVFNAAYCLFYFRFYPRVGTSSDAPSAS